MEAELPAGWLGGNAAFLETASTMTDENDYRNLVTKMLREAKALDAFLLHMDPAAEAISSLRVDIAEPGFNLAEVSRRQQFWQDYAQRLAKRHPPDSQVEVRAERTANTGGRDAYETRFKVTLPAGGEVHYVLHAVAYDAEKSHLFFFQSDSRKLQARYADLQTMLGSLTYAVGEPAP